jgi:hypothetical protein
MNITTTKHITIYVDKIKVLGWYEHTNMAGFNQKIEYHHKGGGGGGGCHFIYSGMHTCDCEM